VRQRRNSAQAKLRNSAQNQSHPSAQDQAAQLGAKPAIFVNFIMAHAGRYKATI
jgi:hypothetical protein